MNRSQLQATGALRWQSKNRGVSGFPGFCQKKMPFPDKGDFTELLIDVFLSEQNAIS